MDFVQLIKTAAVEIFIKAKSVFVEKTDGKGLSTNDFTDAYKQKLDGAVTGVKGNAESTYRSDNVNLTAENVGAVPATRKVNNKPLSADVTLDKSDVGLPNVDNTADLDKPISTATQAALDDKIGKTAGGVGSATKGAYLNSSGKLAPMTYSLETDVPSNAFDPATAAKKGPVKIGSNVNVAADGTISVADATTAVKGITQLSNATDSNAENVAATPKAVKAAYDLADSKQPKETGKDLSTNDYTNAEKAIVDSVQCDIIITLAPVQSGEGAPSPDNVRPITGFDSVTVTKNGQSVTITLPETVYGGTLDVTTGVLTVTHKSVILNGSENWSITSGVHSIYSLPSKKTGMGLSVCDSFANLGSTPLWTLNDSDSRKAVSYSDHPSTNLTVFGKHPGATTTTEWKTWLAEHPIQVVYERSTHVTYQLAATDLTAVASDTVSADAGSVSFAAFTPAPATAAPLMDGTAAVGNSVKYARENHVHPTDTSRAAQTALDAANNTIAAQAAQITLLHELINGIDAPIYRSIGPAAAVSFSDGYPANVKSLSVDIAPVQAGSGTPYPPGAGKNLLPPATSMPDYVTLESENFDGQPSYIYSRPSTASGLHGWTANPRVPVKAETTYTASLYYKGSGTATLMIYFYDSAGKYQSNTSRSYQSSEEWVRCIYTFQTPSDCRNITFIPVETRTYPTVFHVSKFQLELGEEATDYAPYSNIRPVSGFDSVSVSRHGENVQDSITVAVELKDGNNPLIVYGGTLNVTNGILTVTHGYIASYAGEALPGAWISDRDVYDEENHPTPSEGAQVVYELDTPLAYQLTAQQLTTLSGANTISANAGHISVTYRADPTLTLEDTATVSTAGTNPELTNAILSLGANI